MTNPGPARTFFAGQAITMSDLFYARFNNLRFGGTSLRYAHVQEIDVESTAGGKAARMAIVLLPEGADGTHPDKIVCGWLDVGQKKADVRNYAVMSQVFQEKFHKAMDCPEEEYEKFLTALKEFVADTGMTLNIISAPPKSAGSALASKQAPAKSGGGGGAIIWVVVGLVVVASVGAALFFVLSK